ncbi:hypothetical protein [Methylomusa anaerophila]|uniref:Uncharacterized protein n=1 Tax=Methylomusa anaerophila TaxID=1930071 RepID=A0A348ANI6_9FIRM|nr:hypothetical protein [Methylomusa anaerophila]BBB92634.1 hypothetical protein MAMMFC1_03329 [Methylomusa anaerophila]
MAKIVSGHMGYLIISGDNYREVQNRIKLEMDNFANKIVGNTSEASA